VEPSDAGGEGILDVGALSEIMGKHARDLTQDDKVLLIRALRAERAKFKAGEAVAKRPTKSALTKAASVKPTGPISLEDLGL
jgi:hypothetical protein